MKNYFKFKNVVFLFLFTCIAMSTALYANNDNKTDTVLLQENKFVAKYDGHSEEDGYKFILKDGTKMNFKEVSESALKEYDLSSEDLKGAQFEVTYDKNEKGELIIAELKKIE